MLRCTLFAMFASSNMRVSIPSNCAVQAVPTAAYATQPGGTVPGQIKMASGGVARNVAQCLASLLG